MIFTIHAANKRPSAFTRTRRGDALSSLLSSFFYSRHPSINSIKSIRSVHLRRKSMSPNHDITELASISTISDLYKASRLHPTAPDTPTPPPSSILNSKISLVRTSITTLAVTSIVNAANQRLLGGGGVVSAPQHPQLTVAYLSRSFPSQ